MQRTDKKEYQLISEKNENLRLRLFSPKQNQKSDSTTTEICAAKPLEIKKPSFTSRPLDKKDKDKLIQFKKEVDDKIEGLEKNHINSYVLAGELKSLTVQKHYKKYVEKDDLNLGESFFKKYQITDWDGNYAKKITELPQKICNDITELRKISKQYADKMSGVGVQQDLEMEKTIDALNALRSRKP